MTELNLRSKILLCLVGLIFLASLSTIATVIIATDTSVDAQARSKLKVGSKVFDQLLDMRSDQLFESVEVLTADFGFKTAVLTGDNSTIQSVLANHGARIGADIMMLASLEGELIAHTDLYNRYDTFPFASFIAQAEEEGGIATTMVLHGRPFKVIMLPINAPIPAAWTVVGFEINQEFAQQLKKLTDLEVAFWSAQAEGVPFFISTENNNALLPSATSIQSKQWQAQYLDDRAYLAFVNPLSDAKSSVYVVLATSLSDARSTFEALKLQVLTIAVLSLVFSIFVGFILSKNITRPIKSLVGIAERIRDGDYQTPISESDFPQREVAVLASSLSHMQQGIADRQAQILHQAYFDSLTNIENRTALVKRIESLLGDHVSANQFGLLQINILQFKQVNETFGYQVGDKLLQALASRLMALLEEFDSPSRLGADEFVVVLSAESRAKIELKTERIINAVCREYQIDTLSVAPRFVFGLVICPEHGNDAGQLLRRLDIATKRAQAEHVRFNVYRPGSDESNAKQLTLVNELRSAIERNELSIHYQPKFDLKQKNVTQVEALIRWVHPELGPISPAEFIPLAEQSGLMPSITQYVIHTSLLEVYEWQSKGINLGVGINLSAYDLARDDLCQFIESTLRRYKLSGSEIVFEVTESAMMSDPKKALDILNHLKGLGASIAVDDYGTGYSSLSQLKGLPVDELKIDMSFVLNLDTSSFDQAIVKSTIEMGHDLGLSIVAEGVENAESWNMLKEWGCDKLQGYFINKPMASNDLIDWLKGYEPPIENE